MAVKDGEKTLLEKIDLFSDDFIQCTGKCMKGFVKKT